MSPVLLCRILFGCVLGIRQITTSPLADKQKHAAGHHRGESIPTCLALNPNARAAPNRARDRTGKVAPGPRFGFYSVTLVQWPGDLRKLCADLKPSQLHPAAFRQVFHKRWQLPIEPVQQENR